VKVANDRQSWWTWWGSLLGSKMYIAFDGFKKDSGKEPTGNEETKEEQNITCCHHLGFS